MNKIYFIVVLLLLYNCSFDSYSEVIGQEDVQEETKIALGRKLFAETTLSNPVGQACISCHSPETGFSDPQHRVVSEGTVKGLFGNRNAPSIAYAVYAPERYYDNEDETYVGGMFLDGRSKNLHTQAMAPLINPVEMNNASYAMVASKLRQLPYYDEITKIYGIPKTDDDLVGYFADAVSAFELSPIVNSFTSKFDYYMKGQVSFTEDEKQGLALYKGKALCNNCHILDEDERTGKILFTDFTYDDIGVPKNPKNPFYKMPSWVNPAGENYVDYGLGKIVGKQENNGQFKVPTLRNVAVSAPYFHNGSFNTLDEVIHFYNKRKVENLWTPEAPENVNTEELGDQKLTDKEEKQLKAFLETLTDHYRK